MITRHKALRRGISLVEVMISTLLVGLVLSASLTTVGNAVSLRGQTLEYQTGPALARSLMIEVLQQAYTDPESPDGPIGLETGELSTTRSGFDDVDDFNGWNTNSPERDDGSALGYGTGWQRNVTVSFVTPDTMAASIPDTGLKQITVTVTAPDGGTTVLQALRSRLGSLERKPSFDRTFVVGSQLEIQTSATATDIVSGTRINNHGSD